VADRDDPKFILIGSLSYKGSGATDIDLLLPFPENIEAVGLDCASENLAGKQPDGGFNLKPYEDLARKVKRPVDLFLQPPATGRRQLAAVRAWRGREGEWEEGWVAFSRFLDHEVRGKPQLLTAAQIVDLTKT
jgi:hypothetical protein